MAQPLRIHVLDGWYHVMIRGNGGEIRFGWDDDRRGLGRPHPGAELVAQRLENLGD